MTNVELAAELREWAKARGYCNARRAEQGKDPLESDLLIEAASRLETTPDGQMLRLGDTVPDHARSVAKNAVKSAKFNWGPGWYRLSPELQHGLVAMEVVRIVQAQHQQYPETLSYLQQVAVLAYKLAEE